MAKILRNYTWRNCSIHGHYTIEPGGSSECPTCKAIKEEKTTTLHVNDCSSGKIITPEEIHANVHKEIQENQKLISNALYSLSKMLENAKFSFSSLNEQFQLENHLNKVKSYTRKLRKNINSNKENE